MKIYATHSIEKKKKERFLFKEVLSCSLSSTIGAENRGLRH
jgi:hypothetical protein